MTAYSPHTCWSLHFPFVAFLQILLYAVTMEMGPYWMVFAPAWKSENQSGFIIPEVQEDEKKKKWEAFVSTGAAYPAVSGDGEFLRLSPQEETQQPSFWGKNMVPGTAEAWPWAHLSASSLKALGWAMSPP